MNRESQFANHWRPVNWLKKVQYSYKNWSMIFLSDSRNGILVEGHFKMSLYGIK